MTNAPQNDLVLRAIRIAEKAHRTRPQGPHYRKAPKGEDMPYYFVHLAEVAWMLLYAQDAATNSSHPQRTVTDALISLGGSAKKQTLLIAEVLKNNPLLNPTKAHDIIRDTVASGAVVEGKNGRKKTYSLPKQQQPSLPAVQPVQPTP